ncbi:MAG TPA: hypothetical protein VLJ80_07350 [Solirubrobacteraceae bacterium]|nr:hypothetical protein [Solirubrobacteraceae bacterium]
MAVLIVTPRDDPAARQCAKWADQLAARYGSEVVVLTPRRRSEVDEALVSGNHVLYFGHGVRDALIARKRLFKSEIRLADRDNLTGAQKRVVVAIACWSAEELARLVTDPSNSTSVRCYVGWLDEVSWPNDWRDPIGEALVESLSLLFDGQTVGDLRDELRLRFQAAHDTYRANAERRLPPGHARFAKMCALYWAHRLFIEGDVTAVF